MILIVLKVLLNTPPLLHHLFYLLRLLFDVLALLFLKSLFDKFQIVLSDDLLLYQIHAEVNEVLMTSDLVEHPGYFFGSLQVMVSLPSQTKS